MAEVLYTVGKGLYEEYTVPSYLDLISKKTKPVDKRSGKDIQNDILEKLKGE